jgi:hypothetical protein
MDLRIFESVPLFVINKTENPVEWALFSMSSMTRASTLKNLISELAEDGSYDEANLSVDLGHVYAQLNRAWRRRPVAGSIGCSMALVKGVSQ